MLQLPSRQQSRCRDKSTKIAAAFRQLEPLHLKMAQAYRGKNVEASNRYLARAMDAAEKIISMPADGPADMLLKIEAAGVLVDSQDSTGALRGWQADLQGGICDYAAAQLLMTLRDDIKRLLEIAKP